jgi:hypothetical protein
MSPASICSYKTLRVKSTNLAVPTMGRLMKLRSSLFAYLFLLGGFEAIWRRPNLTEVIR